MLNLANTLWSDEGQDIAEYAVMLADDSGVSSWNDSTSRLECQQCIFQRCQFSSMMRRRCRIALKRPNGRGRLWERKSES